MGDLFFTILSGVAEFERELIRERVATGLARARRNGKRLGRPRTITPSVLRKVEAGRAAGKSMRRIAAELGISVASVCNDANGKAGGART